MASCFDDERTAHVASVLRHVGDHGAVVPSLWSLEVANTLQIAIRRGRMTAAMGDGSLATLAGLPIVTDEETVLHAWSETLRMAERHRLTTYDSCYLEVAVRRKLPLATLDRALKAAAARDAVTVV